ncbi:hypothetical protein MANY_30940 [Mycolicibacterium anyangense]|uniref:Uncharacterized protein n=1 Tax=Mycolicibacterium anyangense TaxID=1431246 RepID=A0A6N4WC31_9MYCO|nr:hypothetical protein MANY_30940 [Mycolicibacterium anyangense]
MRRYGNQQLGSEGVQQFEEDRGADPEARVRIPVVGRFWWRSNILYDAYVHAKRDSMG